MKTAIIHDWLTVNAGGERCVEQFLYLFPDADLFTLVDFMPKDQRSFLGQRHPRTSFVQRLPFARTRYKGYLPLMPIAVEQFDLSEYDLVLSSSHAVAKGVLTGPDQVHLSYVHSPMRYAWDLQHVYLREAGLQSGIRSALGRAILHYMRMWDYRTANGVDQFIANSAFIAKRIHKIYRRTAEVVHPPVDVEKFALQTAKEDFYLTASRMVPYKRVPLIADAFAQMPDRRLLIVGDGPEMAAVKCKAAPNVEILGRLDDADLVDLMQRARAFVFAAEEDFGITPVEAQACGTPVIAYGRGGSLETVRGVSAPGRTGVFFAEQTVESLIRCVEDTESIVASIRPSDCRAHAETFTAERFRRAISKIVLQATGFDPLHNFESKDLSL